VAYEPYLPGYWLFGWSGQWDKLPAVHATSILFDTICLLGLALVGRRFGGPRLAATLEFAWVAWPFCQYASSSNTNDMIGPAVLDLGLAAVPRDGRARPVSSAARARGASGRRVARARLVADSALTAAALRAHRCRPVRLRARPDALVISVPAVVLPLRRARAR